MMMMRDALANACNDPSPANVSALAEAIREQATPEFVDVVRLIATTEDRELATTTFAGLSGGVRDALDAAGVPSDQGDSIATVIRVAIAQIVADVRDVPRI